MCWRGKSSVCLGSVNEVGVDSLLWWSENRNLFPLSTLLFESVRGVSLSADCVVEWWVCPLALQHIQLQTTKTDDASPQLSTHLEPCYARSTLPVALIFKSFPSRTQFSFSRSRYARSDLLT
jgi:hypothetical protein